MRSYLPGVCADIEEITGLLHASLKGQIQRGAGQEVAIIGAGPAGLSAAHDLTLLNLRPVVFEAEPIPAGMLALGVPGYRLPPDVIQREVAVIQALGVDIRCGVTIGKDVRFADLRRDFAAVIIAVGAKSSRGLGLPGERGPRVYGGVDLLRAVALGLPVEIGKDVVVIGGGNVAYDVARTVLRQIAYDTARTAARLPSTSRVRLVSLEGLEEMPADTAEILEGDEEGVERLNGWGPIEVQRNGSGLPSGVVFRRCLRIYDQDKKFAPIFEDSQRQTIPCDTVLLAVGQTPILTFLDDGGTDIEMARPDWPKIDPATFATTAPGIFVAGDLAHGTRLLIDAVASGKTAARSVYEYVTGHKLHSESVTSHLVQNDYQREPGYEALRRVPVSIAPPDARLMDPDAVVEIGYTHTQAIREASRCLDCGVTPVFDGSRCVLCGGCADVCPTKCLKLAPLDRLAGAEEFDAVIETLLGPVAGRAQNSAILKDEDRCIRCALCAARCPVHAITMERVTFSINWRSA
jgi:NADPH-dependent glutamate synthase beta subunit-like oxidoreductase